jgi:molybdate transport system substrate-binding protein
MTAATYLSDKTERVWCNRNFGVFASGDNPLLHQGGEPMRIKLGIFLLLACAICNAQEITVAAAADLNYALKDIAQKFEVQTGKRVHLTFGSSGNFFTEIQNGAPYDLFFSADIDYPKKLEAAGLTEPGTLYQYAVGKIVLWVPITSKLNIDRGLSVLADPSVKKVAIANPRHAPYGRAAVAALQSARVYDNVSPKFVLGENISQAAQFVQSGNADVGIIALSLALSPAMSAAGRYYLIPSATYPPLDQAVVVLKAAKGKTTARQFLEFVKSQFGSDVLARYGFSGPVVAGKH